MPCAWASCEVIDEPVRASPIATARGYGRKPDQGATSGEQTDLHLGHPELGTDSSDQEIAGQR